MSVALIGELPRSVLSAKEGKIKVEVYTDLRHLLIPFTVNNTPLMPKQPATKQRSSLGSPPGALWAITITYSTISKIKKTLKGIGEKRKIENF